jgi:signal transduction histidine kinase
MRGIAYSETLKLAMELHPSTEQVFVVAASREQQDVDAVHTELAGLSQRVRLTYIDADTVPQLLAEVRAIPQRSLILYVWYDSHDPGSVVHPDEIARLVASASPVPVYGTNEFYLGSGVVGGVVRGTRETAVRMAEMAREILSGRLAQDIPIESARLVPIIDWRQVQRWGIDPARLPARSDIRFRTPTAWEAYRGYIIAIVVVIVAQSLLITGLLRQRARRRRAEATIRTSYERIRQLAGRIINAQEATRAGIARDLHDDVCQDLVGVSMAVSKLKRSSGRIEDARTQEALFKLQQWSLAIAEGVRNLSHDLHPFTLQLLGLAAALKAHCSEIENLHDTQVSFETEGELGQIQPDVALCLFRIGQEALRNGIVHGHAQRLAVTLARSGGYIELTVTDDGGGFDFEAVRRSRGGLGLLSMEERAHAIGGDVYIVSRLGEGTTIRVRVPADVDIGE